jgi:DNA-binding response OmpR family regulator
MYPLPASSSADILVIEDEEDMRALIVRLLRAAGYEVRTAEDAIVAGHKILERVPDLIITDISMPYMTGVDFIAALRADSSVPKIPVIYLTALEEGPKLAWQTLGYPLLTKPLEPEELLAAVARQLQLHARK